MKKAAQMSIPGGFRKIYIPCLDEKCSDLLKRYEVHEDPDIADELIDALDVAKKERWRSYREKVSFTRSSRKC